MSQTVATPRHVMISSTMKDLSQERQAIADSLEQEGFVPWWAEKHPMEFNTSIANLSLDMARSCDLYLLIINTRYGSHLDESDPLSITHREFNAAKEIDPYKVYVFISRNAMSIEASIDESPALAEQYTDLVQFIREATDVRSGKPPDIFSNREQLREHVLSAVKEWRDSGQAYRQTYINQLLEEYDTFTNPVLGIKTPYDATVMLKLRTDDPSQPREQPDRRDEKHHRPDWDEMSDDDADRDDRRDSDTGDDIDRKRDDRRGADKRRRREERVIRQAAKPLIRQATEFLLRFERLVMVGDVGSGKSTLLRRLVHDTASAYKASGSGRIPILVRATDLGRMGISEPSLSIAEVVGRIKEDETRLESLKPAIRATVASAISRGEALLLVDGLDEANTAEQDRVLALLAQLGQNRGILASRPSASIAIPGWRICDVQLLDETQRRFLIEQVFQALAHDDRDAPDPHALEQAIDDRADLAIWAGNPLLLTLIAAQYLRNTRLPDNRARIYEFAIEDMQRHIERQQPAGAGRFLTQLDLNWLLARLAFQMNLTGKRITTLQEVRETYLKQELASRFPDAPDVALEILTRSGILQDLGDDQWKYVHSSFHEYLAAIECAALPKSDLQEILHRSCRSARWEQVFLLLTSYLDMVEKYDKTDAIILALIREDECSLRALQGPDVTHLALRLATRCHFARKVEQQRSPNRQLERAWWSIWQAEYRKYRVGTEIRRYADWLDDHFDIYIHLNYDFSPPESLGDRGNILVARLKKASRFRVSPVLDWILAGMIVVLTLVFLIIQVSAGFWRTSSLGIGAEHITPIALVIVLAGFIGIRLLFRIEEHSKTVRLLLAGRALNNSGEDLPPILPLLENNDWRLHNVTDQAINELVTQSLPDLLPLLRNRNPNIRYSAAQAIGAIGSQATSALPDLLPLLKDFDSGVCRAAAQAIGAMGPQAISALPDLLPLLKDFDPGVRRATAQAIGAMRSQAISALPDLLPLLRDIYDYVRNAAAQAIGALGPQALPDLLPFLKDSDSNVQSAAAQAIGVMGPQALPSLLPLLKVSDSDVRRVAARAIRALGLQAISSLPALLPLLRDSDSDVRRAITQTLNALENAIAWPSYPRRLTQMYRHPGWQWASIPLACIDVLFDWPVLVFAIFLQIFFIWPAAQHVVLHTPTMRFWLGFTSWWQVLSVMVVYTLLLMLVSPGRRRLIDGQQKRRAAIFPILEGFIRRRVADADSTHWSTEE